LPIAVRNSSLGARFRISLDHHHHPHVVPPSCPGRASNRLDRV
jgi:hypothetical protein